MLALLNGEREDTELPRIRNYPGLPYWKYLIPWHPPPPPEEQAIDKSIAYGLMNISILVLSQLYNNNYDAFTMEFTVTVDTEPSKVEVPVSKTQVHTIKIVLPVHANHHGTTFGGQVCRKASA